MQLTISGDSWTLGNLILAQYRFWTTCRRICIDFGQHAREYKDFGQHAREYIDLAQHAREYIDFIQQADRQIGDLTDRLGIWQIDWGSGRQIWDLADRLGIWQTDWGSGRQIGDLADRLGIWQTDWGSGAGFPSCIPLFLHPSFSASLLFCIPHVLPPSCPALGLRC